MASAMVPTEDEALELLAFLITAARAQLDRSRQAWSAAAAHRGGTARRLHGRARVARHA